MSDRERPLHSRSRIAENVKAHRACTRTGSPSSIAPARRIRSTRNVGWRLDSCSSQSHDANTALRVARARRIIASGSAGRLRIAQRRRDGRQASGCWCARWLIVSDPAVNLVEEGIDWAVRVVNIARTIRRSLRVQIADMYWLTCALHASGVARHLNKPARCARSPMQSLPHCKSQSVHGVRRRGLSDEEDGGT